MCVVALALNCHPRWRLVLIGNRDEFHARPSAPLAHWAGSAGVIGGRDLASGGMWLGVAGQGRLAVVTNLTGFGGPDATLASRGALVHDWLANGTLPDGEDLPGFNPFNLVVIDRIGARLISNRPAVSVSTLGAGIHALSNAEAVTHWPRKALVKEALANWLSGPADDPELLFAALAIEHWPDGNPGLREDGETPHSPVFIRDRVYGTRASTLVLVDADGNGRIIERSFGPEGVNMGQAEARFGQG